ncbi:hypothetical protein IFM89_010756 [Coptis chinensis]|uniref:Pentatricopeptide repeat-containing protein n=1 Tax=Coptis chinensis TaxID=261450 RepID=A0A835ILT4_9MAGN|nr:hypothetical protein IFM89_010756 [Coptis chinensis]
MVMPLAKKHVFVSGCSIPPCRSSTTAFERREANCRAYNQRGRQYQMIREKLQVVRIARFEDPQKSINAMDPNTKSILQLLRLRQYQYDGPKYQKYFAVPPFETAHLPFDEIPKRSLYSLNSLLSRRVRRNDTTAAWGLFIQMRRTRTDLDAFTFTPVIAACSSFSNNLRGKQVHALFIKYCSELETVANTALLDMYFKCDCANDSVKVFEEMKYKDVITWNTMISGLVKFGMEGYAVRVFKAMREERVEFSGFILCSVLKACAVMKSLKHGKEVHALVIVMGCDLLVLSTALIDLYSDCGMIDEGLKVFSYLSCKKDNAIYNALVSGCVQNRKYKECFSILSNMRPNVIALTSGLVACSMCSDFFMGKQIHCVVIRFGFQSDTQLSNALLDMYAKCGKGVTARLLFDRIRHKTVVSWTSIIGAYGSQGCGIEAYELFKVMESSGVSPNSVTFLAVLSACGHSGLVEQGRECFISMRKNYGIDPDSEHYACFIDLLGRAGLVDEVWDLFYDMSKRGTRPTGAVLAALVNACRLNMDIERGEYAAKCLIELEPDKPANIVSLSNFYAAIGRWDRVEDLRNIMNEKGLRKEAGSSWITIK